MTSCPITVWARCWRGTWKRVLLCVARDSTTANVNRQSTNTGTVYFTNVMLCANENGQLTLFSVSFGAFECKSRSPFSVGLLWVFRSIQQCFIAVHRPPFLSRNSSIPFMETNEDTLQRSDHDEFYRAGAGTSPLKFQFVVTFHHTGRPQRATLIVSKSKELAFHDSAWTLAGVSYFNVLAFCLAKRTVWSPGCVLYSRELFTIPKRVYHDKAQLTMTSCQENTLKPVRALTMTPCQKHTEIPYGHIPTDRAEYSALDSAGFKFSRISRHIQAEYSAESARVILLGCTDPAEYGFFRIQIQQNQEAEYSAFGLLFRTLIQTPLTWACGECSVKKQQQKSQTHRCQGCQAISREMCLRVVLLGRARLVARGRLEGLNFRRQFISPFIWSYVRGRDQESVFFLYFLGKTLLKLCLLIGRRALHTYNMCAIQLKMSWELC